MGLTYREACWYWLISNHRVFRFEHQWIHWVVWIHLIGHIGRLRSRIGLHVLEFHARVLISIAGQRQLAWFVFSLVHLIKLGCKIASRWEILWIILNLLRQPDFGHLILKEWLHLIKHGLLLQSLHRFVLRQRTQIRMDINLMGVLHCILWKVLIVKLSFIETILTKLFIHIHVLLGHRDLIVLFRCSKTWILRRFQLFHLDSLAQLVDINVLAIVQVLSFMDHCFRRYWSF